MASIRQFWLMKSEPDVFSLDHLQDSPDRSTLWDGVRNYQARNFMRDSMRAGDGVLFYHSNCATPGVVGLARITSEEAEPDPSQFDPQSKYFDPKSDPDNPRWLAARVSYVAHFKEIVSLAAIKADPVLSAMKVAQRGMRLSVQPVEEEHFFLVCRNGGLREAGKRLDQVATD